MTSDGDRSKLELRSSRRDLSKRQHGFTHRRILFSQTPCTGISAESAVAVWHAVAFETFWNAWKTRESRLLEYFAAIRVTNILRWKANIFYWCGFDVLGKMAWKGRYCYIKFVTAWLQSSTSKQNDDRLLKNITFRCKTCPYMWTEYGWKILI